MTLANANDEALEAPIEESNSTTMLQAVNYLKTILKELDKGCRNLTDEQQMKLCNILKQQHQLFLGCPGKWRGNLISIKVIQ
jgi:hypothetical protein